MKRLALVLALLCAAPVWAQGDPGLLDDKEGGFLTPLHALHGGAGVPSGPQQVSVGVYPNTSFVESDNFAAPAGATIVAWVVAAMANSIEVPGGSITYGALTLTQRGGWITNSGCYQVGLWTGQVASGPFFQPLIANIENGEIPDAILVAVEYWTGITDPVPDAIGSGIGPAPIDPSVSIAPTQANVVVLACHGDEGAPGDAGSWSAPMTRNQLGFAAGTGSGTCLIGSFFIDTAYNIESTLGTKTAAKTGETGVTWQEIAAAFKY